MLNNNFLPGCKPELWGGMECTINRVGDQYYDQLSEGGYYDQPRMLDLVSTLRLKAFRYPILWERHEPVRGQIIDWSLAASDIGKLKSAGVIPIVGLLHHGSGPTFTDLLDADFGEKFQDYALKVACAFPDIHYYTPINEPLTTARFSGLYGFWYPHGKQPLHFAKMLLNQVKGIVLAMRAIKTVNPLARLVQTEDLAKVHATDALMYQAEFENIRRWISFDLLCGKVGPEHPMWQYLTSIGVNENELMFFTHNSCAPDILGLNYYVTSERFLDHRCHLYPNEIPGNNGIHSYVDIAACRSPVPINLDQLLKEAWDRYHIPLALTEVHIACTREEQLRWFSEVWHTAQHCVNKGIDVCAVTAWSLFGAYDWNSLVTIKNHHYESGAFSTESNLRDTAVAAMLKVYGKGGEYDHPLVKIPGWWRSPPEVHHHGKRLLVVGKKSSFTDGLTRVCRHRRIPIVELAPETDPENMAELLAAVSGINAWGIVDTLHMSADAGEPQHNVHDLIVSRNLASVCTLIGIPYMIFARSTIVDNPELNQSQGNVPELSPIEALISKEWPAALIIRSTHTFSPWDSCDFAFEIMQALKDERTLRVPSNVNITPTYLPHLLNHALDLFIDRQGGTWTLINHQSAMTWSEFATSLAQLGGYSQNKLIHTTRKRGSKIELTSALHRVPGRSIKMPNLHQAIEEYLIQLNS